MGTHKAPVKIHRAEKYALRCLNDDTKAFFLRNFGCARKVYTGPKEREEKEGGVSR